MIIKGLRHPLFPPLLLLLLVAGCARPALVRHLSAEVCLLAPDKTTKQEVLGYMGEPAERQLLAAGNEAWIYHNVQRSLLRKTPYIGEKLGHEEYEVVKVIFMGDVVSTCVYRLLSEEEFKEQGLPE